MLIKIALLTTIATIAASTVNNPAQNPLYGLAEYGVLGICVIALSIALVRKDRQVNALYIRLIEKSEKDASKYHELGEALEDTLKELVETLELK